MQQYLRENAPTSTTNSNSSRKSIHPSPTIVWDFLPPGDAHNRCDAAAAHWKRPMKKLVRDFTVLTSVGHLAFACCEMRNSYLIEAEYTQFPDPLDCLIEEPWMRDAFRFEYGTPYEDFKYCKHITEGKCKLTKSKSKKPQCNHQCCNKNPIELPCVDVTIQDRDLKYAY